MAHASGTRLVEGFKSPPDGARLRDFRLVEGFKSPPDGARLRGLPRGSSPQRMAHASALRARGSSPHRMAHASGLRWSLLNFPPSPGFHYRQIFSPPLGSNIVKTTPRDLSLGWRGIASSPPRGRRAGQRMACSIRADHAAHSHQQNSNAWSQAHDLSKNHALLVCS